MIHHTSIFNPCNKVAYHSVLHVADSEFVGEIAAFVSSILPLKTQKNTLESYFRNAAKIGRQLYFRAEDLVDLRFFFSHTE